MSTPTRLHGLVFFAKYVKRNAVEDLLCLITEPHVNIRWVWRIPQTFIQTFDFVLVYAIVTSSPSPPDYLDEAICKYGKYLLWLVYFQLSFRWNLKFEKYSLTHDKTIIKSKAVIIYNTLLTFRALAPRQSDWRNRLLFQLFHSLRWPIYVFNSVVNTKLPAILSHRRSTTVSLETYPLYSFSMDYIVTIIIYGICVTYLGIVGLPFWCFNLTQNN